MISRSEIAAWAERFGVTPPQIARDHFISHVLHALASLQTNIRFLGGTALCRTHLEGTRLSEDVDLLHPDPRAFLEDLTTRVPTALRREFPDTSCSSLAAEGDGYAVSLAPPELTPIKLYAGRDGANTIVWEFVTTEVALRYGDLPATQDFQCPTLSTFAAMKLAAWFDSHASRDLFDLAGLAELGALSDPTVRRIFTSKMGFELVDSEFVRAPRFTAEAWETELAAQVAKLPNVDECLDAVRRAINASPAS